MCNKSYVITLGIHARWHNMHVGRRIYPHFSSGHTQPTHTNQSYSLRIHVPRLSHFSTWEFLGWVATFSSWCRRGDPGPPVTDLAPRRRSRRTGRRSCGWERNCSPLSLLPSLFGRSFKKKSVLLCWGFASLSSMRVSFLHWLWFKLVLVDLSREVRGVANMYFQCWSGSMSFTVANLLLSSRG